jgi:hypothetical protein
MDTTEKPPVEAHKAGWCIHYRAGEVGNRSAFPATCKAGEAYAQFKGVPFNAQPCFDRPKDRDVPKHYCAKRRLPTPEEAAAAKRETDALFLRLELGLRLVAPLRLEWKGKNVETVLTCPACNGKLHVTHAAYNGHVHAHCQTAGCISWME